MLHFLLSPLYEYNLCYCEVIDTNQNQSKTIHSFTQSRLYYYAVGRSNFNFLRFSKMDTVLSIGFIFISSILKYQQLFSACPRGREFIFLNHRDLKNKFLFCSKNKRQKEHLGKVCFFNLMLGPKNWANLFNGQTKNNIFLVSLNF